MSLMWPFQTAGGRIQDLKAPELAEAALRSIQRSGRTAYGLRLVYRALELDPFQPHALLVLTEFFHSKKAGTRPTGDEIYAGLIVEYAMDRKSTIPHDLKVLFDKKRVEVMRAWGFVAAKGTEVEMDHIGYMTFINELMHQVHSVPEGFRAALLKAGVHAGALHPTTFKPTPTYTEWLHSPATTLHN